MYLREYIHPFGFGLGLNQTKTIPISYQNHTKTKPHKFVHFSLVLVWFLKQNQNKKRPKKTQKSNKNQINACVQYEQDCTEPLKLFSSIFGSFLMLVRLQKPNQNQNQTKIYE